MPTVIGIQTDELVVLAGDGRAIENETVVSDSVDRLFHWPAVAIAVLGPVSGTQATRDAFDSERRRERHRPLRVEAVEHMLERACRSHDCDALAGAVNEVGDPILSVIRRDGGTTREPVAALGSGAQLAIGHLDRTDWTEPTRDIRAEIERLFEAVSNRDPTTGSDVDILTFDGETADRHDA